MENKSINKEDNKLEIVTEYLSNKYPDNNFEVISYNPPVKIDADKDAYFLIKDVDSNKEYEVFIAYKNNEYYCYDNYYQNIIRKNYDEKITDIISECGYTVKTYTDFPSYIGEEVNSETTTDDIIDMGNELYRITSIYSEEEIDIDLIRENFISKNIYGSFFVYIIPSIEDSSENLRLNNANYKNYSSFNCFY